MTDIVSMVGRIPPFALGERVFLAGEPDRHGFIIWCEQATCSIAWDDGTTHPVGHDQLRTGWRTIYSVESIRRVGQDHEQAAVHAATRGDREPHRPG